MNNSLSSDFPFHKGVLNLQTDFYANSSRDFTHFIQKLLSKKPKYKIVHEGVPYIFVLITEKEVSIYLENFKQKSNGIKVDFLGESAFIQRLSKSGSVLWHGDFNKWIRNEKVAQTVLKHFNCTF